jgi:hypothetical protein
MEIFKFKSKEKAENVKTVLYSISLVLIVMAILMMLEVI